MHKKESGRVLFALRLGGGGYLVGYDGAPSVIVYDADMLVRVAGQFMAST